MVFPLLAPMLLAGGSYLAGKSGSGGAIEIGTSKKQSSTVSVVAPFSPFIYQPTNNQDYSTNIISNSAGASMNTKKENAGASAPISYELPIQMGQAQGGTALGEASASGGLDLMSIAIFGGLGLGAFLLIKKQGDKK